MKNQRLLMTVYCLVFLPFHDSRGILDWYIKSKIANYGDSLKLVCPGAKCCNGSSYWIIWSDNLKHIKKIIYTTSNSTGRHKYNGGISKTGYELVIKNLHSSDVNTPMSCSDGKRIGIKKTLRFTDIFKNKDDNRQRRKEDLSRSTLTDSIFGVVCASVVVITFLYLIIRTWRKRMQSQST